MKEWIIAFNNAKTMETNGLPLAQIIAEYERVLRFLPAECLTESETHIWNEACRNLFEIFALEGNEEKAAYYNSLKKECAPIYDEEDENVAE